MPILLRQLRYAAEMPVNGEFLDVVARLGTESCWSAAGISGRRTTMSRCVICMRALPRRCTGPGEDLRRPCAVGGGGHRPGETAGTAGAAGGGAAAA